MRKMTNPAQLERWMFIYSSNLKKAVETRPDLYAWPIENLGTVIDKMRGAFERGDYGIEGLAIKWTAKEIGFKPTRTNINNYLTATT